MFSQPLWMPVIIILVFLFGPLLAEISTPVAVNLKHNAILSCTSTCNGEILWTFEPNNANLKVLKCDQGSCTEGDGFRRRAHLKHPNMSLIIHPTVYNDEGWYEARCNSKALCIVHLDIFVPTTVNASVRDNIVLPCYARTEKSITDDAVNILWKRNNQTVLEVKNGFPRDGSGFNERVSVSLDNYRDGDLSLSISRVTPSDNGPYLCFHKAEEFGDPRAVMLTVTAHTSAHEKKVGDDLTLNLLGSDEVTVTFNNSEAANILACTVKRSELQCDPEYVHRVSVVNDSLVLSGLSSSDSGTFTLKDNVGNVLSVCTVTVKGVPRRDHWMAVFSLIIFVLVCVGLGIWCWLGHRKSQKQQRRVYFNNNHATVDMESVPLREAANIGLSLEETNPNVSEQPAVPHTPIEETSPQTTKKQGTSVVGFT